jgi:hypothetical protein
LGTLIIANFVQAVRDRIAEEMTTKRDYGGYDGTAVVHAGFDGLVEEMVGEENLSEID